MTNQEYKKLIIENVNQMYKNRWLRRLWIFTTVFLQNEQGDADAPGHLDK